MNAVIESAQCCGPYRLDDAQRMGLKGGDLSVLERQESRKSFVFFHIPSELLVSPARHAKHRKHLRQLLVVPLLNVRVKVPTVSRLGTVVIQAVGCMSATQSKSSTG